MLSTSEKRRIEQGREEMEATHPMEGSLHPKGQVVTLHPTKKQKECGTDTQSFIIHQFQDKQVLKMRDQNE